MRKFCLALVMPAIFYIPVGMATPVVSLQAGKNYTVTNEPVSQSPKVLEFFRMAALTVGNSTRA